MRNLCRAAARAVPALNPALVRTISAVVFFLLAHLYSFGQCTPASFTINQAPTVIGTAGTVGAKYRRTNVSPGVDIEMEILAIAGSASVASEDDAVGIPPAQPASGYYEPWQPVIGTNAGTSGSITWKISFFTNGSSFATPYRFNCLSVLALDIDGDATSTTREYVEAVNPYSYVGQSGTSFLTYTQTATTIKAQATTTATIANIDSTRRDAEIQFDFKNIHSFTYITGFNKTNTTAANKQFSLLFRNTPNFTAPFVNYFNTDNDATSSINEANDLDDDNDGIPDTAEYPAGYADPLGDADGDNIPNYMDATPGAGVPAFTDINGDGINDKYDIDLDGLINSIDLDSDNDGIPDLVEAGGIDTNGDGVVDVLTDTDSDGLVDTYDTSNGGVNIANLDTDGDGIKNAYDLDSDNDGIPDLVEAGGTDANNDGKIDGYSDIDSDGLSDAVDGDVGNDGTAENTAGALIITSAVGGTPGRPASYPRANQDLNGLPNPYDLDADGDGILDSREAAITQDTNNDGVVNSSDTGYTDSNGDGWSDQVDALASLTPPNTDGTGKANYLDIDSDDDGIPDIIEGQTTAGYTAPSGTDTDGDGLDNTYDNVDTPGTFGGTANNGIIPTNTDGTDNPDYTDLDSDNDSKSDRLEGWDTNGNAVIDGSEKAYVGTTDTDGDGLLDEYDAISGIGTANNTTNNSTPASFPDVNNVGGDRDWRQVGTCSGNKLFNPSFELPTLTGNGNHIYGAGVAIPGWRVGGNAAFNIVVPAGSYVGGPDAANDGNRYLDITNSAGIFTQMFDLTCPSSVGFGGSFSSREAPGYINWTAKIELMKLDGTIVATSTTRNFTAADADGNPGDAVWYPLSGASSGLLPAGRYLYKVTMGDYGNFDNAYLCVTGCYKYPDADGDLVGSTSDIDDDNDGIINTVENGGFDPYADTDNDGIPNYTDATPGAGQPAFVDVNGDGINDFYDTDKDGIINSEDLDSDNDGIPDLVEAGGIDTNGDGRVDVLTDTDGDGLANTYDTDNGGVNIANLDTDGDGIPNFKDLDSDNDGYPDVTEAGGADSNNDGKIDGFVDTDNDGLSDTVDGDVGNDGTAENTAGALIITSAVGGTPGRPASYPRANQDATGLPNPYDLDSDGDGILDIREANITDSNGDGVLNSSDTGYTDTNGDGWSDQVDALATFVVVNTDGRGKPNFLDIDSDDDGIVDNVEGQSTAGYIAPAGSDADGDGIDDNYDNNDAAFGGNTGNGIIPVNTDGVDAADYLDLDSDNDGYPDSFEGHDTNGDNLPDVGSVAANGVPGGLTDADGDGLLDGYDNNTSSPDPTNGGFAASAYPNLDGGTTERDWREVANTDNVGGGNTTDVDDDNDGITDIAECGGFDPLGDADGDGVRNYLDATPGAGLPVFVDANNDGINDFYDTDQDGIINSLDLDSDNDGIADLVEAGGIDTNGDGVVDITTDTDGDGLANIYDTDNGGVNIANLDTDGDGIKNAYDLDSDGDGIPDVIEAGGTDANNDGKLDGYTDTDGDGFAQSVDGDANNDGTAENTAGALIITGTDGNADGKPDTYPKANTDRTGLPNPYDLDSDGDGILDVREAGITDTNNDGIADGTLGSDGWSDTVDALASLSLPNSDGRGPANYLDIDSDDDGITDNVEGQTTAGYILPTGTDTDGDGIDNAYDNNNAAFGGNANNGITPNNHDGLDNPDYTDTDSDNDGVSDLKEGTGNAGASLTITTDADGDGLLDQFDTFNLNVLTTNLQNNVSITGMGAGGSATGPSPAGSNVGAPKTNAGAPNRDWRNSLVVLAVNLTTFNVVYNANVTTVLWTAANEVNFNHYVVERSVDGVLFQPLTTVAARGTGGDYSTPDNNLPNVNKVYYRLQLVTNDGHFTYSKVIVISRVASNNITVYPNPVKDNATINFTVIAAQKLSIKVYDAAGKTVIVKTYLAQQGTNAVQVNDWNHLAAGQYIIEVAGDSFKMVQRVSHNR